MSAANNPLTQNGEPVAWNFKLLAQNNLSGFGGMGEGMSLQLAKDGRRILWLAHESAPKNFTGVDVTDLSPGSPTTRATVARSRCSPSTTTRASNGRAASKVSRSSRASTGRTRIVAAGTPRHSRTTRRECISSSCTAP